MLTEPMSLRIHPPTPQRLNELPTPRGLRVRFTAADACAVMARWSRTPCADGPPAGSAETMRIPVE